MKDDYVRQQRGETSQMTSHTHTEHALMMQSKHVIANFSCGCQ